YLINSITVICLSNDTTPTPISPLSLHDALPIFDSPENVLLRHATREAGSGDGRDVHLMLRSDLADQRRGLAAQAHAAGPQDRCGDRKSTRLNSSHVAISYAVFCLKKKQKKPQLT